jgi:hypothetical protein
MELFRIVQLPLRRPTGFVFIEIRSDREFGCHHAKRGIAHGLCEMRFAIRQQMPCQHADAPPSLDTSLTSYISIADPKSLTNLGLEQGHSFGKPRAIDQWSVCFSTGELLMAT